MSFPDSSSSDSKHVDVRPPDPAVPEAHPAAGAAAPISPCPVTTADHIQFYVQISVLAITTLVCLAAIIADPNGPNVRYFESVATFCVGLFLPNPKQPSQGVAGAAT